MLLVTNSQDASVTRERWRGWKCKLDGSCLSEDCHLSHVGHQRHLSRVVHQRHLSHVSHQRHLSHVSHQRMYISTYVRV